MKIVILIAALIGDHGSSQISVPFDSMESCNRAELQYQVTMKKDGAPGWTGDGGVIVKTMCVEVKK